MAVERFPPKLMFRGDWTTAQNYVRTAKSELDRTLKLADRMGATQYARTTDLDTERGVRIITTVHGEFTNIIIEVAPTEGEEFFFLPPIKEEDVYEFEELKAGIYSGFAYTHQVSYDYVDGPPPLPGGEQWINRLHDFCPTIACREAYPDDFTDADYQPVTRIWLTANNYVWFNDDPDHDRGYIDDWRFDYSSGAIAQTNLIHPCMYSGPLARACSLALGNGTFNLFTADEREALLPEETGASFRNTVRLQGYKVEYGHDHWRNETCMQDNLGNWWLISIHIGSFSGGVFARPMPIITKVDEPTDPVEKAAVAEFGGIPTGEGITNYWTAWNEVDDGNWLALLDMDDDELYRLFRDEYYVSHGTAWVYNDTGTEGRMCTYQYTPENFVEFTYWSITFEITTNPSTGEVSGNATLVPIERGVVAPGATYYRRTHHYNSGGGPNFPIGVFTPGDNRWFTWTFPSSGYTEENIFNILPAETEAVIWVGWIDGGWHEIKFNSKRITKWDTPGPCIRCVPNSQYDITGLIPPEDEDGVPISYSEPARLMMFPSSPHINRNTFTWTVMDEGYRNIVSNSAIAQDMNFMDQWYTLQQWKAIYEVRVYAVARGTPVAKNIWCTQVPYNRNAYFIYDYSYDSGGGDIHEDISATHIKYVNAMGLRYSMNADVYRDCDNPGYPYPYPQYGLTPYPAFSQPLCVPPGDPWTSACPGHVGYMANILEDYHLARPNCYPTTAASPPISPAYECDDSQSYKCENFLYNRWHKVTHSYRASGLITGYTNACQYSSTAVFRCPNADDQFLNPAGGTVWDQAECDEPMSQADLEGKFAALVPSNYWHSVEWEDAWRHLEHETILVGLVADGLPGSSYRYIGQAQPDDEGYYWIYFAPSSWNSATSTWWCQTAVLGARAAIYSDPRNVIYTTAQWPYVYYPIVTEGTHPPLPTDIPGDLQYAAWEGNDPYRWLTFVGVNGP